MAETLRVHLGERSYSILFAGDLTAELRGLAGELAGAGRGGFEVDRRAWAGP